VNVLVVCLFFVIPFVSLLLVPWIQAFRLYQEKVAELATEQAAWAQERIALTRDRDALLAKPDPGDVESAWLLEHGRPLMRVCGDHDTPDDRFHADVIAWMKRAHAFLSEYAPQLIQRFYAGRHLDGVESAVRYSELRFHLGECDKLIVEYRQLKGLPEIPR
jgi:hypothetical protein